MKFMLITDGKLVAAWGDTTHLYRIHSIRKSLMSALYGERRPPRHSHRPNTFWYYNNWDFNVPGSTCRKP